MSTLSPAPPRDVDAAWAGLERAGQRLRAVPIARLAKERRAPMIFEAAGLRLLAGAQRLDAEAWEALHQLARSRDHAERVRALFRGERINETEGRAVLHPALRQSPPGAQPEVQRFAARAVEVRAAMARAAQRWLDDGVADLVHVGIGGSDLGPRLVHEALAADQAARLRVHFVANVDGHAASRLCATLDPARTAVCVVSKSFTTPETLINAERLRRFLGAGAPERLLAVTAKVDAARAWEIAPERILPMWDEVGGRFSLWSAVGFPILAAYGPQVFDALLAGAAAMDRHYAEASAEASLPLAMALLAVWNRNALGHPATATIPYDDRLRLLPSYLQQLEMESNGKRVDRGGRVLTRPAAPITWGDVGTNAQHAFFQSLHQGVDTVPLDFVGVLRPAHRHRRSHRALMANLIAQSAAFLHGRDSDDPHRAIPGDRPHSVILLDALTPAVLGALLAAYEHKVHALGVLWDVNSFDQFGVELGKRIAMDVERAFDDPSATSGFDAQTATLAALAREALASMPDAD